MILELDIGRCANDDVGPLQGWIVSFTSIEEENLYNRYVL